MKKKKQKKTENKWSRQKKCWNMGKNFIFYVLSFMYIHDKEQKQQPTTLWLMKLWYKCFQLIYTAIYRTLSFKKYCGWNLGRHIQNFICRFLEFSLPSTFIKYKIVDSHKWYKVTIFIVIITGSIDFRKLKYIIVFFY